MVILVQAQQHDTLDLLSWRHLGTTVGVVEAALELNHHSLNEATLQHGQWVTLPESHNHIILSADIVNLRD